MAEESSEGVTPGRRVGIILSGAGSRGAYEAGVLSVLLPRLKADEVPRIIVGTSAGSLNAAMLASLLDQPLAEAATALIEAWKRIEPAMVFTTPRKSVVTDIAQELFPPSGRAPGLVDTGPLRETIGTLVDLGKLHQNVEDRRVDSVGVVASACSTTRAVVFVERDPVARSADQIPTTAQIAYVDAPLAVDHLMASSAFPIAFPPQWVEGNGLAGDWYVDGGVHLNAPLKPAIDLGADRLLVIGGTPMRACVPPSRRNPPNMMDSAGQLLHAQLIDKLAADLVQLRAINRSLRDAAAAGTAPQGGSAQRLLATCVINPPDDALSKEAEKVWPAGLKDCLHSLGGYSALGKLTKQHQRPGQLLSYLCFDTRFIEAAIEKGAADANDLIDRKGSNLWDVP